MEKVTRKQVIHFIDTSDNGIPQWEPLGYLTAVLSDGLTDEQRKALDECFHK